MNESVILDLIKCCAPSTIQHVLEQPKSLSCGHCVCSKCNTEEDAIKCAKCDQVNDLDVAKQPVLKHMEDLVKMNVLCLTDQLYAKSKNAAEKIHVEIEDLNEKIEKQFEFLEDDISVYIQSLKMKLDDIEEKFKKRFRDAKEDMKKFIFVSNGEIKEDLQKFESDINRQNFDVNQLYEIQSKLTKLTVKLEDIRTFDYQVKFNLNDNFKFDETSIATFYCNYENPISDIVTSKAEFVQLEESANQVLVLSDGNILVSSSKCLSIYDSDFKLLKTVDTVNNEIIKPISLAEDMNGNIYFSDWTHGKRIIKVDKELNYIDSMEDSNGKEYASFCIYGNRIYACVFDTNCIEIFTLDFSPIASFDFKSDPREIKILNDIACVRHATTVGFYQLPSFSLLFEYTGNGSILTYDKWFFVYENENYGLSVFDKNAYFIDRKFAYYGRINDWNSGIAIVKNHLVLCLDDKKIAKIKLKF